MLVYAFLLAFIGFSRCLEIDKAMPTRHEIESSINRTIEEVEKLVDENPTLPKLSRNDIVDILYNITSKDMSSIEDEALKAIERTRSDYQRALMVVLPYQPKDTTESLKEIYTKPPIVQIVVDEPPKPRKDSVIQTVYNASQFLENNIQQSENYIENKHQLVSAHMTFQSSENITTTTTTTTPKTTITSNNVKIESAPQKFSFNLSNHDLKAEASYSSSIATKRPIYKGTFSRYRISSRTPPKLEIIYSSTIKTTTTTEKTDTTTTEKIDTTTPEKIDTTTTEKIDTTTAQNKPTQSVLSSDQWHYNAPPVTTTLPPNTEKPDDSPWKPMLPSNALFLPTVKSSSENEPDFTTLKMEDIKTVMETTTSTTVRPSPIFVTPSNSVSQKKVVPSIESVPSGFKLTPSTTTTTTPAPMRAEVEQLLKSIGLQPMKSTKTEDSKLRQNAIDAKILNALLNADEENKKQETIKVDVTTINKENSFETPQSPIKSGVKNLSPEIQLLFQQFGLPISDQEKKPVVTTTTTTLKPKTTTAKINSYTNFKPLPTSSVRDKDFRNFLARFGLGFGDNRNQKAIQPRPVWKRPALIDIVPNNMRKILENIGLIKKTPKVVQKDVDMEQDASLTIEQTTTMNDHVFKPEVVAVNKEQNDKIKNLLTTVKMVQEGKADVQDVQKVAHELLESTRSLGNGPDPVKLEEILNNYRDNLKNEVKRQEKSTTTVTPSTTEPNELASSTTTTVSPDNAASSTDAKTSKPSFFDTFDPFAVLNETSTTTKAPDASSSTGKSNFFDTFDANEFLKKNNASSDNDSGRNTNTDANVGDLEDSFGGSTAKPDPVLPTRPKTGLYFLVDWNSFLEVGEEGNKDRVNLRFAPKAGDRTRFIPVKIP